jgi:hypothetical protein
MAQTLAKGWSRNVLLIMIKSGAHRRQGRAITNFEQRLPAPQSDLARQTLKDPYVRRHACDASVRCARRPLRQGVRLFPTGSKFVWWG